MNQFDDAGSHPVNGDGPEGDALGGTLSLADTSEISREVCGDSFAMMNALRSMAGEGDIVLPLEVCLLRRGETFREWAARAKRCGIEATRRASGGTMSGAAARLGVTRSSLKGHLERARAAHCAAAS